MPIWLAGGKELIQKAASIKKWVFERSKQWNINQGRVTSSDILKPVRLMNAFWGLLTCLIVYFIGKNLVNIYVGMIAALLLGLNPLMISCCRKAMTDAPLIFFMTLTVLLMIKWYQGIINNRPAYQNYLLSILMGISIGTAIGIKLNGGLLLFLLLAGVILLLINLMICRRMENFGGTRVFGGTRIILSFLIVCMIASSTFISFSPNFYANPFKSAVRMIKMRSKGIASHGKRHPRGLYTLSKKTASVLYRTLMGNFTTLASFINVPFELIFFLVGCVTLIGIEWKSFKISQQFGLTSLILFWVVIIFLGVIIWIPFSYSRYYLPVIPPLSIVCATAIAYLINIIIHLKLPSMILSWLSSLRV